MVNSNHTHIKKTRYACRRVSHRSYQKCCRLMKKALMTYYVR